MEGRSLVAAVGEELEQERVEAKQRGHHQHAAIPILNVGGMDERVHQQGALKGEHRKAVEAVDESGDYDVANVTVGEAIGLIRDLPPVGELVERLAAETEARLAGIARAVITS